MRVIFEGSVDEVVEELVQLYLGFKDQAFGAASGSGGIAIML
jgi:hypothetical protein